MRPSLVITTLLVCLATATATAANAGAATTPPGCPAKLTVTKPVNRWAATRSQLLPAKPVSATLCRYRSQIGLSPNDRTLLVRLQLPHGQTLTKLVKQLRSLHKLPTGVFNCPADFGPSIAIFFSYPEHRSVEVLVDVSGCQSATNGHVTRANSTALTQQLRRLLPSPAQ